MRLCPWSGAGAGADPGLLGTLASLVAPRLPEEGLPEMSHLQSAPQLPSTHAQGPAQHPGLRCTDPALHFHRMPERLLRSPGWRSRTLGRCKLGEFRWGWWSAKWPFLACSTQTPGAWEPSQPVRLVTPTMPMSFRLYVDPPVQASGNHYGDSPRVPCFLFFFKGKAGTIKRLLVCPIPGIPRSVWVALGP